MVLKLQNVFLCSDAYRLTDLQTNLGIHVCLGI